VATRKVDDKLIDRQEFQLSLGIKESLFVDRMFLLFDGNSDGFINFSEYLNGLSVLSSRGTLDEKIKFSFRIYDFDCDSKISDSELSKMLQSSLAENDVKLTAEQTAAIVKSTFLEADVNRDGFIDMGEYKRMVDKHPSILSNMTLDFRKVIEMVCFSLFDHVSLHD
jgi:serine/threonine-protein phosphatase 2B regulatory subunit